MKLLKSKNQLRREKHKQKRQSKINAAEDASCEAVTGSGAAPVEPRCESAASNEPRSSVTMLARRYDWVTEASPLFDMYRQVSARFKRARPEEEKDRGDGMHEELADGDADNSEDDPSQHPLSNKKRRQEQKPRLADLKKLTRRPELVEWYDTDAQDPEFLVYLKSLPHAVQVPSNWRNRTDIPNFAPQGPYELPHNVANTGIMEMREPNDVEATSKPGRLDVDYEKMHSAFFEQQETPQLTGYGQVRDPKSRTLAFKPKRGRTVSHFVPGSMSLRLREALGLNPEDEEPWAEAMKMHGPPPGYRHHEPADIQLWGTIT